MARDDIYRLTPGDEVRAIARMRAVSREWSSVPTDAATTDALVRIGAHAMGCGLYDLRDCEIAWLESAARELQAVAS